MNQNEITNAATLLAQADVLLGAGALFAPPSEAQRGRIERFARALPELLAAAELDVPGDVAAGLAHALDATPVSVWTDEYYRLFDGPTMCPLNEAAYIRRDRGALLGDLSGFYRAFGLDICEGAKEKPDHIAAELEFVAMLLVLLARARVEGNHEGAFVTSEAIDAFAFDHLGEWLPLLSERLSGSTPVPIYQYAAALLPQLWRAWAQQSGVALPDDVGPVPPLDHGTPYECDMADRGVA